MFNKPNHAQVISYVSSYSPDVFHQATNDWSSTWFDKGQMFFATSSASYLQVVEVLAK